MKRSILFLIALLLPAACKSTSGTDSIPEYIKNLKDTKLDGTNWLKMRFCETESKKPVENLECIICVVKDDGQTYSKLCAKTDRDGWISIKQIPDNDDYLVFWRGIETPVDVYVQFNDTGIGEPNEWLLCEAYMLKHLPYDESETKKIQLSTDEEGRVQFENIFDADEYYIHLETKRRLNLFLAP